MQSERLQHLQKFYSLLAVLQDRTRAPRLLANCSGQMTWPTRGVYFFMEEGESRTDTGDGPRIVRVGTHALHTGSGTKLWTRLSQHRGQMKSGGGNHRGSIFRLIVGTSLVARRAYDIPTWGKGNNAAADIRAGEVALEKEVSQTIGAMPFLWLAIDDEPGPNSLRGFIERNSIALLSNYQKPPLDPPSKAWLGHRCDRERVRSSGLWNQNHVNEAHDPEFLTTLERLVSAVKVSA